MTGSPRELSFWALGPSIYLPSLLYFVGHGAMLPIVALSARELGASVATASLVVALLGIGQIFGDLPAGMLAVRLGEHRAMLLAAVATVAALALCISAPTVWMLGIGVALNGMAMAVWMLARHAYLTEVVPYRYRARALSTLGGVQRVGLFIGPFVGAAVMGWLGTDGGYWVHVVAAATAAGILLLLPLPSTSPSRTGTEPVKLESTAKVIRRHLPVLRTLGMGALMVGAARAARQAAIPLWADHIGLDAATTSLIFGLSGAAEMLLFYPAGMAMDRFGRRWVVVLSMVLLGVSYVLLPLTQTGAALTAVAMLVGLGNGMGSGIIMTVGADVSPPGNRAAFLGAWRLCSDVGSGMGPVALSALTAAAALGPAIAVMGGFAWLAAVMMGYWIPRHTDGGGPPS